MLPRSGSGWLCGLLGSRLHQSGSRSLSDLSCGLRRRRRWRWVHRVRVRTECRGEGDLNGLRRQHAVPQCSHRVAKLHYCVQVMVVERITLRSWIRGLHPDSLRRALTFPAAIAICCRTPTDGQTVNEPLQIRPQRLGLAPKCDQQDYK